MDTVRQECGRSFQQTDPQELVSRLLPYIVHVEKHLKADGTKPKEPTLTDDQVSGLEQATVETLLRVFIDSQDYLYRKLDFNPTTNDAGQSVQTVKYGEVLHPQKEGETNANYLQRLFALDEEKRVAEHKALMAQFNQVLAPAHFSEGLAKD